MSCYIQSENCFSENAKRIMCNITACALELLIQSSGIFHCNFPGKSFVFNTEGLSDDYFFYCVQFYRI